MRNKFMQTLAGTFLGLLILIVGTQIFVSGQSGESQRIEGTWRTIVTPRNCQTGDAVAPPFQSLLSFNRGGTLVGTSTVAASVFGVWQRGHSFHDYSFAFANLRYNTSGVFIGTQTVRQTAALSADGNGFTTTGTVEIFDTNGNLIGTGCSTSTGTRFE